MQKNELHSSDAVFEKQNNKTHIFISTNDGSLIYDFQNIFNSNHYKLDFFSKFDEIVSACTRESPDVIVMDIIYGNNDAEATNVIKQLKDRMPEIPPVIYISECANIEAQLSAVRNSIYRYFVRPLNTQRLKRCIDTIVANTDKDAYRVLLVDDEEAMLRLYATILRDGGMEVEVLSKPQEVLSRIEKFKPDVIVIDVRMSDWTGRDLTQLIRLNDDWAIIPIICLSIEIGPNEHIASMDLGVDDFLVKPVEPEHLFVTVYARAKRARKSRMLNERLKGILKENKYQLVTMDEHAISSSTDVEGNITSINKHFCKISGYSHDELIGQNHRILKSGYHTESFYKDMWRKITSGKVWRGTLCNRKKNGDEYWVESTIVPFLNDKGKPHKYVSVRTDISALRKSEERLHRSHSFANIGTWDWNIVTGELFWSDRIGALFGYDKKIPETTYENFIAAVHPDDREMVIGAVDNCVKNGTDYNVEHRVVWPDNTVHWVLEKGNVIRSENGEPLHMLGVVQDINKLKSTQLQLMQACNEAESANLAKSRFLSSMSHELRTPMNAILGFGQLLKMEAGNNSESQNENIDEIINAGRHLLDLINEVLDLSKIESGRLDLSIETIDLGEVILESVQTIMSLAQKRRIEIEVSQEGNKISFDEFTANKKGIRADHIRMRQVLLNLMSNAVKYNNEGGKIIISCDFKSDNKWRVGVTDTGNGLSKIQLQKLFVAFERMGAEQSEVEGTGIGLVITKKIVELMGGEIGVCSEKNKGSTFWVEFTAENILQGCESEKNKVAIKDVISEKTVMSEKKYNVLYIEDNPANLRLITQLMARRDNINLITSPEPELGLELAIRHLPDLILLDINLPGISGYEVLKKLREMNDTKDIQVIAISANAMPKDIEKGMEAGFYDYITKPVDVGVLLKTVDDLLQRISK